MRLVQLKSNDGKELWVDADRVIMLVQAMATPTTPLIGATGMFVEGLAQLVAVEGTPPEVAERLRGRAALSLVGARNHE